VPKSLIKKYGAVSKEVAEAMAKGIQNLLKTDISIATTGIFGPEGGSSEKPVGTTWIRLHYLIRLLQKIFYLETIGAEISPKPH